MNRYKVRIEWVEPGENGAGYFVEYEADSASMDEMFKNDQERDAIHSGGSIEAMLTHIALHGKVIRHKGDR